MQLIDGFEGSSTTREFLSHQYFTAYGLLNTFSEIDL
jgi:hypothetical protein